MAVSIDRLGALISAVDSFQDPDLTPEEQVVVHELALAMLVHAHGDREAGYVNLVEDVRDLVKQLDDLETTAAAKLGMSVPTLRAALGFDD